jgi:hypothetical protein
MEVKELVKFTQDVAFNHLGSPEYFDKYRNLLFTPSGFARLWHTVGYCQAAMEFGSSEGQKLLLDLEERLVQLNSYGGDISDENRNPSYRVVVGDDGCWGSFNLKWYKAITPERFEEYRKENKDCMYQQAIEWLRIDEGLKLWSGDGYIHYGYSFNGGLILHIGDSDCPLDGHYGIHT